MAPGGGRIHDPGTGADRDGHPQEFTWTGLVPTDRPQTAPRE
jgi:hypothetical protein